jgi:glucose-1-phosphate cytidylyltransferase
MQSEIDTAVILCGGRGARFDHETQVLPKPLIEVAGKPILRHIMDSLEAQGVTLFILAVGYLGDEIVHHFEYDGGYACLGQQNGCFQFIRKDGKGGVKIVDTGQDSHTGERLARLRSYIDRRFLLTYGDGLSDVQVSDVLDEHTRDYAAMPCNQAEDGKVIPHPAHEPPLVTLTAVNPPGRFGVLQFNPNYWHHVREFREKTNDEWINGGFMIVEPEFIDRMVTSYGTMCLEDEALPGAASLWKLRAHRHKGYWRCMDSRRDLELIEFDVEMSGGKLPWLL